MLHVACRRPVQPECTTRLHVHITWPPHLLLSRNCAPTQRYPSHGTPGPGPTRSWTRPAHGRGENFRREELAVVHWMPGPHCVRSSARNQSMYAASGCSLAWDSAYTLRQHRWSHWRYRVWGRGEQRCAQEHTVEPSCNRSHGVHTHFPARYGQSHLFSTI